MQFIFKNKCKYYSKQKKAYLFFDIACIALVTLIFFLVCNLSFIKIISRKKTFNKKTEFLHKKYKPIETEKCPALQLAV
jgi:hypothetical protein